MRFTLSLAALAATLAVAAPAFAESATVTTPATAKGVVLLPLTLTKSSDLDFGTVIASKTAAGTVVINADDGTRSVTGGVVEVPNYAGGRALFQGAGTADQNVVLTLSAPAVLTSGTHNIAVNSMYFDTAGASANDAVSGLLTTTRKIDDTGAFEIGVGGDFAITANQANGLYTGAFSVTAEYQ